MPYASLTLPSGLPAIVEGFIRHKVESDYLSDVHRLLSTTIAASSPRNQIQRPIALTLLATIGGVSRVLYSRGNVTKDGELFRGCVVDFYPFDLDPPAGVTPQEAASILYEVFRCPLVHSLGTDGHNKLPVRIKRASGYVFKLGRVFRGTTDAEAKVEDMERGATKPHNKPWLVVRADATVLWLDNLYWGVRKMVERWALDSKQVALAEKNLEARIQRITHRKTP